MKSRLKELAPGLVVAAVVVAVFAALGSVDGGTVDAAVGVVVDYGVYALAAVAALLMALSYR